MTSSFGSVCAAEKMTTHKSQGNGRASPPPALASRVPGNSETEISGHGIAPLLHRAPVWPMPTQHVGMLTSICFLPRHNNATLKRHSAAAAILSRHNFLKGLTVIVAEIDPEEDGDRMKEKQIWVSRLWRCHDRVLAKFCPLVCAKLFPNQLTCQLRMRSAGPGEAIVS